jgi:glycosyltransferase involved in cell wall biosynthesis
MKILLVVSDLALGGAQQVVINLANELVRQNHNVWIFDVQPEYRVEGMISRLDNKVNLISKNYGEEHFSITEKVIDFTLNKVSMSKNLKNQRFKKHVNNLNSAISSNVFDYANPHTCWADFFVYKELKNLHSKWIISFHASYNNLLVNKENITKYGPLIKKTINAASKIIYIHDEGISFLENTLQIKIRKIKKIYNGIPAPPPNLKIRRQNLEIDKDDIVILCASRASKLKGWYELSEAVLKVKNPKIKLFFAGEGEILDDLKNKYSKFGSTIKFLGFQKEINSLITISDIICLPSYTEALPTILIESIFHNKPVIATNVGETAIILENKLGKCGVLINAKKGEELIKDLINTINSFMLDKFTSDKEAFEEAKELFSSKKMTQNYLNYFSES